MLVLATERTLCAQEIQLLLSKSQVYASVLVLLDVGTLLSGYSNAQQNFSQVQLHRPSTPDS